MKKVLSLILVFALGALILAGCAATDTSANGADTSNTFDSSREITVVSREDGSGTRGAFIELFEIQEKADDGTKVDRTTEEAIIAPKTDVMLTNIANDPYAIGYVSLGSLNSSVKPLQINGVDATVENVKNGSYAIARPFNIATNGTPTGITKDFIDFILSAEGQAVVAANGYIAINETAPSYTAGGLSGEITVAGSSSVTPVMEKLKEAYEALNSDVTINVQMSDSTAGMTGAIEGTCDIGMASRDLKDSELEVLTGTVIAMDGIAVIVNNVNPLGNVTAEQVKSIFTGETITWDELD